MVANAILFLYRYFENDRNKAMSFGFPLQIIISE